MLLTNAQWLAPNGTWQKGSIVFEANRIAELLTNPNPSRTNETPFNCEGFLIFPGAIDAHVHFREPGIIAKEGLVNGSFAALTGGVTTVFDMPNTVPPCCSREAFDAKRQLFSEKAPVNWGLFFDVSLLGNANAWPYENRPFGKLYMAKSSPARPVNDIASVAKIFSDYSLVAIHAEDENLFIANEPVHHIARPRESVVAALVTVEKAWELANPKPQIILCHIGTAEEIEWVKRMRAKGARIAAETCPHYILLTQNDYLAEGNIYKVNPPLREESDRQALCEALRDGTIDFLSTDHAPHLPEEKSSATPPSGIAGIEWYYPLALLIAKQLNLSNERLQQLVCQNAARTLCVTNRAGIVPGNFADLVLIEKTHNPQSKVVTRAATRPFGKFPLEHIVKHVFVNGNLVLENGILNTKHLGFELPHAI